MTRICCLVIGLLAGFSVYAGDDDYLFSYNWEQRTEKPKVPIQSLRTPSSSAFRKAKGQDVLKPALTVQSSLHPYTQRESPREIYDHMLKELERRR